MSEPENPPVTPGLRDFSEGMTSVEVVSVIEWLERHGVTYQVNGGWAVDALIGRQSRVHGDLDVFVDESHVSSFGRWLAARGYAVVVDWSPVRVEWRSGDLRVDVHPMRLNEQGDGLQAGFGEETFMHAVVQRTVGHINGRPVVVANAERLLELREGYAPRPVDRHDIALLHAFQRTSNA